MLIKLENGMIMQVYDSDNCLHEDGADSCVGYCVFNADGSFNDSGELDYDSRVLSNDREVTEEAIKMAMDEAMDYEIIANTSDCYYEDMEELLAEEFSRKDELENLEKALKNPVMIMMIEDAKNNLEEE